jgi:hypothetical protein
MLFKSIRLAALTVVVATLSTIASADLPEVSDDRLIVDPGMTGVADMGVTNCEVVMNMHLRAGKGTQRATLNWVAGYIFGKTDMLLDDVIATAPTPANGGTWDWQTTSGFIIEHCKEDLDATLPEVADLLLKALTAS